MMKLGLALAAAAMALSGRAQAAPVAFAHIGVGYTIGGLHIEIAKDGVDPISRRMRWIAVADDYQMLNFYDDKSHQPSWTDSKACPALDRLAAKIVAISKIKHWNEPFITPSEGGNFSLGIYITKDYPGMSIEDTGGGHPLADRVKKDYEATVVCLQPGLPPPGRRWSVPGAIEVRDVTPE